LYSQTCPKGLTLTVEDCRQIAYANKTPNSCVSSFKFYILYSSLTNYYILLRHIHRQSVLDTHEFGVLLAYAICLQSSTVNVKPFWFVQFTVIKN
jgi:hypothetical protein